MVGFELAAAAVATGVEEADAIDEEVEWLGTLLDEGPDALVPLIDEPPHNDEMDEMASVRQPQKPPGSMVAFLLSPDGESPDTSIVREAPNYHPVPRFAPRVRPRALTLDAEAWSAARRARTLERQSHPAGPLDLRKCADRMARYEPVEHLPRRPRQVDARQSWLLIDAGLPVGPYGGDARDFSAVAQALFGPLKSKRAGVSETPLGLMAGEGPIWTFRPIEDVVGVGARCVLVTGGTVDNDRQARWELCGAKLESLGHRVALVWIGDRMVAPAREWINFRSW